MIHPYQNLPAHCFWKQAVARVAPAALDPMTAPPFRISRLDKVATAGSCFAQHIARHLRSAGFHFLVTEPAPAIASPAEAFAYNYGSFTARYGNIYTARQLLQLLQRAYGAFVPADTVWRGSDGEFLDPFRPAIQPGGFSSREELLADRFQHFRAVRKAFATLDVFVFTLGLTEAWAAADGAVFPVCPAVVDGSADPSQYRLHNFRVADVVDDTLAFIDALREVNPDARVILTVSPVPLAATALKDEHVLSATTYSKSVLRAACGEIQASRALVAYMPAYEIITGSYARGRYFAEDLRAVTEEGVGHVMRVFLSHFAAPDSQPAAPPGAHAPDGHAAAMQALVETNCDEALLQDAGVPGAAARACPLCGGHIFGYGPGGRAGRAGTLPHCVQCGSLERHRSFARVVRSLPATFFNQGPALQAGAENCIAPAWFTGFARADLAALDALPAAPGGYGLIGCVYGFEFIAEDCAAFDALAALLSPDGVLAVCFVTPAARAATVSGMNPAALPGQPHQLYGGDLARHFDVEAKGLHVVALDSVDPCTGETCLIHLFFNTAGAPHSLPGLDRTFLYRAQ